MARVASVRRDDPETRGIPARRDSDSKSLGSAAPNSLPARRDNSPTAATCCYLLRSNLSGVDAATLWRRYIQLTEAEWAFRIAKDELSIRPIWHQKEARVKSHILVCFLAYVLWKTLAGWMRVSGLGDAPRTVLDEMKKLKSGDVTLRARSPRDGSAGADRQITMAPFAIGTLVRRSEAALFAGMRASSTTWLFTPMANEWPRPPGTPPSEFGTRPPVVSSPS